MAEVIPIPVPWVGQETLYYCGPAVAQMTLAALGVAPPPIPPTWQDRLWSIIQTVTDEIRPSTAGPGTATSPPFPEQLCEKCSGIAGYSCWSTSPGALERLLNGQQAVASYTVRTTGSDDEATITLLNTLDGGIPGLALVRGWQHWVVVDGYAHSGPGAWVVGGKNLNGVFLRNPQVTGVHYVDWIDWKDDYLRFVPCGQYANTIVVLDGHRLAPPPPTPSPPSAPTHVRILGRDVYVPRKDDGMISPDAARAAAEQAAASLLQSSERWVPPLASKQTGTPLLVQRLDRYDDYYYIVPFKRAAEETARMVIDAASGRFKEASAIEKEGDSLPPYIPPLKGLEARYGRPLDLPSVRNRVLRSGTIGQHPVLAWRPCKQSTSPVLPFYLVSIGDRIVYWRVDGEVFDELTDGPA